MTDDELIRSYLATGGIVTKCRTKTPKYLCGHRSDQFERFAWKERHRARKLAPINRRKGHDGGARHATLCGYMERWQELVGAAQGLSGDIDWWAAYDIGPCDLNRAIAEAAALYVIARDEGLESAKLYQRHLCH